MKKIAIDIRMWNHPGIGRYLRELVGAIAQIQGLANFRLLGRKEDFNTTLSGLNVKPSFEAAHSKIYSISEQFEIWAKAGGASLLHVPHFNIPVMSKVPLVVTIHDLIYLHDAKASKSRFGRSYVNFLFRQIQRKAAAIITVSEYTKKDLLASFPGISPDKVFVTHEAASGFFQPVDDRAALEARRKSYGFSKPFVLFVGSLKAHKNIPVLIRALDIVREKYKIDAELMIVGRRDTKNNELWETIQKKSAFVRYLGELPDEELAVLYNLASVFVLPSLREGFGLPVIEAMACGTPVIASDRTSLPELAGDAALLFNPENADELAAHLCCVLVDESLRRRLSMKSLMRAREFSWAKTAARTLDVYKRVTR